MSEPVPAPVPKAPHIGWPLDLSRVRLGPRFMGHFAHGGMYTPSNLQGYRSKYGYHTGLDFLGPLGLKVFSYADGVVVESSKPASLMGYGHCIVIHHPTLGLWTRYGHLDSRLVKVGDIVRVGQPIGRLGTSGTDNAHLHFDVIGAQLPLARFNPHNPLVGGVRLPRLGLDPLEDQLTRRYFRDPLAALNSARALNPVTQKVVQA